MSQPKFISAIIFIVILTTSIFTSFIVNEYLGLRSYMGYIAENGKSALFHEEYINQNIAFRLSRAFSPSASVIDNKVNIPHDICQYAESVGETYGLNLLKQTLPTLSGTLQTRNPECADWSQDVAALANIQEYEAGASSTYSFSNYTGYTFNNVRYYIDLINNYIYINRLVDTHHYTFNNWLVSNDGRIDIDRSALTINIDATALNDLHNGNNIVSHIYRDGYTEKNIISMLTPVFQNNTIKGVIVTDINISDLATSFYTAERPLLWRFLSLYVTDNTTGDNIVFHRPTLRSVALISHQEKITRYYTLHIKLDGIYIVLNMLWLIALYVLSTWLLCRYARQQLVRHQSLSRDNVTDAMTGLYNRKIMTPMLDKKIQALINRDISVTVAAVDIDGLKRINDTLGHHLGDKAIQFLGKALAHSIRKSDYGIRLGGDEFCLILIDYNLTTSQDVIARVYSNLAETDKEKLTAFSYGIYQLRPGDTLDTALLKADDLLYQHKRNKYTPR
ncbi:diguanylate cyclase DgcJ [Candidatus Symbiopectobacterium sp. NZEC127]|uniref:diguanylate cyclase DgcJ n=1 Tax=Candidatus Symbiopectobacterium sp. NZEC127 TaxID=2820472 RepID=UPI00222665F3|nr:diguanylate cyclase DgcJ [Candidatus Symbiopectobacterium sp. NZEC127]